MKAMTWNPGEFMRRKMSAIIEKRWRMKMTGKIRAELLRNCRPLIRGRYTSKLISFRFSAFSNNSSVYFCFFSTNFLTDSCFYEKVSWIPEINSSNYCSNFACSLIEIFLVVKSENLPIMTMNMARFITKRNMRAIEM